MPCPYRPRSSCQRRRARGCGSGSSRTQARLPFVLGCAQIGANWRKLVQIGATEVRTLKKWVVVLWSPHSAFGSVVRGALAPKPAYLWACEKVIEDTNGFIVLIKPQLRNLVEARKLKIRAQIQNWAVVTSLCI